MGDSKAQERKFLADAGTAAEYIAERNKSAGAVLECCIETAEDSFTNLRLVDALFGKIAASEKEISILKEQLDRELEWEDYETEENVRQGDYGYLARQSDTRFLTDEEAKDMLYDWYGFAKEKVVIQKTVPSYQMNRHRKLRRMGNLDRRPAYNSTDWNYIRFDCGAMAYELHNGTLNFFVH